MCCHMAMSAALVSLLHVLHATAVPGIIYRNEHVRYMPYSSMCSNVINRECMTGCAAKTISQQQQQHVLQHYTCEHSSSHEQRRSNVRQLSFIHCSPSAAASGALLVGEEADILTRCCDSCRSRRALPLAGLYDTAVCLAAVETRTKVYV